MDPSYFYYKDYGFVNHSDHRAIGEATLDAVYPLARDLLSFPDHRKEGLEPHKVKELLLSSFMVEDANCFIDVTETIDKKIEALSHHRSQIDDIKQTGEMMKYRASELGKKSGVKYAEAFVRLVLPE